MKQRLLSKVNWLIGGMIALLGVGAASCNPTPIEEPEEIHEADTLVHAMYGVTPVTFEPNE